MRKEREMRYLTDFNIFLQVLSASFGSIFYILFGIETWMMYRIAEPKSSDEYNAIEYRLDISRIKHMLLGAGFFVLMLVLWFKSGKLFGLFPIASG